MLQGEHSATLLTFIKLPFVIKIFVLSIFEWPLMTGFSVYCKADKRPFTLSTISDMYGRCSKILNASCLPKSHRQTVQTKIRLLLIRVFPVCYSDRHFVNSRADNQHFILGTKEKFVQILKHLLYFTKIYNFSYGSCVHLRYKKECLLPWSFYTVYRKILFLQWWLVL